MVLPVEQHTYMLSFGLLTARVQQRISELQGRHNHDDQACIGLLIYLVILYSTRFDVSSASGLTVIY